MKTIIILFFALFLFSCKSQIVTIKQKRHNTIITRSGDTLAIKKVRVMRNLNINDSYKMIIRDDNVISVKRKLKKRNE